MDKGNPVALVLRSVADHQGRVAQRRIMRRRLLRRLEWALMIAGALALADRAATSLGPAAEQPRQAATPWVAPEMNLKISQSLGNGPAPTTEKE